MLRRGFPRAAIHTSRSGAGHATFGIRQKRTLILQHFAIRRTGTCFLVGEVISLLILLLAGRIEQDQMLAAVYLVPAVLVGSALSRVVHAHINGPALRLAVLIFSIVSGAALILKG